MSKILVTGCTGLIGKVIYDNFLALGFNVAGFCRSQETNKENGGFKVDLSDKSQSQKYLEEVAPNVIIHAAAIIPKTYNSDEAELSAEQNAEIDNNIISYCKATGTRLVFLSSVYMYNRMDSETPLTETAPIVPEGPYLNQKYKSEKHIEELLSNHLILRISSPIGPQVKDHLVFKIFLNNALSGADITIGGDGSRVQDFIYVQDIADSIATLLEKEATGTFNMVHGTSSTMKGLAELIVSSTSSNSKILLDGKADAGAKINNRFSNEKLLSVMGKGGFNLDKSIQEIIAKA